MKRELNNTHIPYRQREEGREGGSLLLAVLLTQQSGRWLWNCGQVKLLSRSTCPFTHAVVVLIHRLHLQHSIKKYTHVIG